MTPYIQLNKDNKWILPEGLALLNKKDELSLLPPFDVFSAFIDALTYNNLVPFSNGSAYLPWDIYFFENGLEDKANDCLEKVIYTLYLCHLVPKWTNKDYIEYREERNMLADHGRTHYEFLRECLITASISAYEVIHNLEYT